MEPAPASELAPAPIAGLGRRRSDYARLSAHRSAVAGSEASTTANRLVKRTGASMNASVRSAIVSMTRFDSGMGVVCMAASYIAAFAAIVGRRRGLPDVGVVLVVEDACVGEAPSSTPLLPALSRRWDAQPGRASSSSTPRHLDASRGTRGPRTAPASRP